MGCLFNLIYTPTQNLTHYLDSTIGKFNNFAKTYNYTKMIGIHIRIGDRCLLYSKYKDAKKELSNILHLYMISN